jgi:hypothetical protein
LSCNSVENIDPIVGLELFIGMENVCLMWRFLAFVQKANDQALAPQGFLYSESLITCTLMRVR